MSYIEGHAYFGCPIFFSISNKLEGENGERSSNTLVMIPSMDLKLLEAIDHGDFEFIQKKSQRYGAFASQDDPHVEYYPLESMDTIFGVSCPCQICIGYLTLLGEFCMCVPAMSLKLLLLLFFKQDIAETREQKESNTLSQNKENIHILNNNIVFKN